MAKSRINPATPATTHNRRGSPWSEVDARASRREFRKPPSMRLSQHEPAPSRLCSQIRCPARDLTASRSSRSSRHERLGAERQCTKFAAACATVAYADKPSDGSGEWSLFDPLAQTAWRTSMPIPPKPTSGESGWQSQSMDPLDFAKSARMKSLFRCVRSLLQRVLIIILRQ